MHCISMCPNTRRLKHNCFSILSEFDFSPGSATELSTICGLCIISGNEIVYSGIIDAVGTDTASGYISDFNDIHDGYIEIDDPKTLQYVCFHGRTYTEIQAEMDQYKKYCSNDKRATCNQFICIISMIAIYLTIAWIF